MVVRKYFGIFESSLNLFRFIYKLEYVLFWQMFCLYSERTCIWVLLGIVPYECQLGQVD